MTDPFEMTLQQAQREVIELRTERAMIERQFKRMAKRLNAATGKCRAADNIKVAAEARSHDMKEKYRSVAGALERCERDALRYRWLRADHDRALEAMMEWSGYQEQTAQRFDEIVDTAMSLPEELRDA